MQNPNPKTGIIDSQSVKITDKGGIHGYDGGKKINGRKNAYEAVDGEDKMVNTWKASLHVSKFFNGSNITIIIQFVFRNIQTTLKRI